MYHDRCLFFTKMGACRHGDHCTKVHVKPNTSPTVLFPLMYPNPAAVKLLPDRAADIEFDEKYLRKHFERFYKETWRTFMEFGRIAEMRVVSNLGDHLLGNVYIRFESNAVAERTVKDLQAKRLNDILVLPELCPVTNFVEACCKEDHDGSCGRGAQCNYLHIMRVSRKLMEKLEKDQNKYWKKKERAGRKRSRSRSHTRSRSAERPPRNDAQEA